MGTAVSLDDSYDAYPRIEEAFQQRLDESLGPRGPDALFELVASLDVPEGGLVVDVGCGEGGDAVALAARFGLRVHGVDPVQRHLDLARAAVEAAALTGQVRFSLGTAEELPVEDATAAMVWCKEVLMHADLGRALGEVRRVLRPDGVALVHQVLTGPRMSDAEAEDFWAGLGARSVRAADIEAAAAGAGLTLHRRVDFGGEWGEHGQERAGAAGRRLLHASRLLRRPDRYVAEFGEVAYGIMLGDCLWHVYRMIGKLEGVAFVVGRPPGAG